MPSSGMLRRIALVRTDVSKERSTSTIKVTRIDEQGTMLLLQKTALFIVTPRNPQILHSINWLESVAET
jgi:hypothetical protein